MGWLRGSKCAKKKRAEGKNEGRRRERKEKNGKGEKIRGGRKSGPTVEDLIDRLAAPAQYP